MEDCQKRVVVEKEELDVKINKLAGFLYSPKSLSLWGEQIRLLRKQLTAMQLYSEILGDRINLFTAARGE